MAKFLMLGKYSLEGIRGIAADRTTKAIETITKAGGKVNFMYALLGDYDLAFMVEFPGISEVLKTSVALADSTGVSFTTFPALTVEEFDKIVG